jgi:hypothetical protein
MQKLAEEVDRDRLQIVSFHPGQILSETARSAGLDENSLPFDDGRFRGLEPILYLEIPFSLSHTRNFLL